ncbi:CLUMA_CG006698, isoform A [Clunio marinus]|uniref:CLUMA_CG006698, isoform A n=1 Tax=Clunio marinus TaxID=568069 RepID=A0A1J1I2R1_9DIPT|nr:CLUMA_CG006698, isoform A [Clunio marinus]
MNNGKITKTTKQRKKSAKHIMCHPEATEIYANCFLCFCCCFPAGICTTHIGNMGFVGTLGKELLNHFK